jgi:hypothetical protein
MTMAPHQERVVIERDELREKIAKLNAFLDGDTFNGLPADERRRLIAQEFVMCQYEHILNSRIACF